MDAAVMRPKVQDKIIYISALFKLFLLKLLLCPSLEASTGKEARIFGKIVRQLLGGKK